MDKQQQQNQQREKKIFIMRGHYRNHLYQEIKNNRRVTWETPRQDGKGLEENTNKKATFTKSLLHQNRPERRNKSSILQITSAKEPIDLMDEGKKGHSGSSIIELLNPSDDTVEVVGEEPVDKGQVKTEREKEGQTG